MVRSNDEIMKEILAFRSRISGLRLIEASDGSIVLVPRSFLIHSGEESQKAVAELRKSVGVANREKKIDIRLVSFADSLINEVEEDIVRQVQQVANGEITINIHESSEKGADVTLLVRAENAPTTAIKRKIDRLVRSRFEQAEFILDSCIVISTDATDLPLGSILHALKIAQPASADALVRELAKQKLAPKSARWLSGQLDQLRKRGLISWDRSGQYRLTAAGLDSLAPSHGRGGSDVARALALGHRKW